MSIFKIIHHIVQIFEGWTKLIIDKIRKTETYRTHQRLTICNSCQFKTSKGLCHKCGCLILAKVRVDYLLDNNGKSIDGCPLKKW